ncbi:MAG: hypothetical protein FWD73_08620 [Polyangiaceae bacterium]|nr:hypothetical protein [Polyangiaceae bacterium]
MNTRAGITKKVSLSVRADDLKIIKERARRLHGGNVSAVFADLILAIKRQEAWAKAEANLGGTIAVTDFERSEIDRELFGESPRRRAIAKRRGR